MSTAVRTAQEPPEGYRCHRTTLDDTAFAHIQLCQHRSVSLASRTVRLNVTD